MKNNKIIQVIDKQTIESMIYIIRGQKVMLDFDLAKIYGYSTTRFNIPTDNGIVVKDKNEDFTLPFDAPYVIKAQVHSGGRGKAGGVKVAKSLEEAKKIVNEMIGTTLYTKQVPSGKVVNEVLITDAVDLQKQIYLSLTLDAASESVVVISSLEGGTEIEEVALNNPSATVTTKIPYEIGLKSYHALSIAKSLKIKKENTGAFVEMLKNMYKMFFELDCSLIEINPLIENDKGLIAIDAKVNFDDNALYRHPDILALRDIREEDQKELEASKYDLNFVSLNGNIGCLVNGAGLAMATMDIIKSYGGEPANFLDVGGSATVEKVTGAFKILLSDPNIKAIMVNIFGGIMKCDIIAQGIVEAVKTVKLNVPLIVRLDGTNVKEGKEIIAKSNLNIIAADSLHDAVVKAVEASR